MTSTVFSPLLRSRLVTRLAPFVGYWFARAAGLVRAILHRRDVAQMLELDERGLKDIGLIRNDVIGALSGPLARDPSVVLMVRSVECRARIRALGMKSAPAKAARPVVPTRSLCDQPSRG